MGGCRDRKAECGQELAGREVGGRTAGQLGRIVRVEVVHPFAQPLLDGAQQAVPGGRTEGVEATAQGGQPGQERGVVELDDPVQQGVEGADPDGQERPRDRQDSGEAGGERGPGGAVHGSVHPGGDTLPEGFGLLVAGQHADRSGGRGDQRGAVGGQPGEGVGEPDASQPVGPLGQFEQGAGLLGLLGAGQAVDLTHCGGGQQLRRVRGADSPRGSRRLPGSQGHERSLRGRSMSLRCRPPGLRGCRGR